MTRRRFVRHPRWYAGDRSVGLRNDHQLSITVGVLPENEHTLAATRMERVVNPPLDRVLTGSMSLLRAEPGYPDTGFLLQEMRGKAVPQCMNTDALGNAGACCGEVRAAHEYLLKGWLCFTNTTLF